MNQSATFSYLTFSITFVFLAASDYFQRLLSISFPSGIKHFALLLFLVLISGNKGLNHRTDGSYSFLLIINFIYAIVLLSTSNDIDIALLGATYTYFSLITYLVATKIINTRTWFFGLLKAALIITLVISILEFVHGYMLQNTFRDIQLIFIRELGAFGTLLNFGVIAALTLSLAYGNKKYIYIALVLTLFVFMTILKKAIVINMLIWCASILLPISSERSKALRSKKFIMLAFPLVFCLLIYGFYEQISADIYTNIDYIKSSGESHVRIAMYIAAFNVMVDYFPLGSGFGTFLSPASLFGVYSELYDKYQLSNIYYFTNDAIIDGQAMFFDAYWAHIISELGVVGAILYSVAWFYPLKYPFSQICEFKIIDPHSFFIICSVLMVFLEGFVLYTPEQPLTLLLNNFLVGIAASQSKKKLCVTTT